MKGDEQRRLPVNPWTMATTVGITVMIVVITIVFTVKIITVATVFFLLLL